MHIYPLDAILIYVLKSAWGISTVGRTSLQLFIPDAKLLGKGKTVVVRSVQNLAKIFGALAQLVARNVRIVEVRGSNPLCSIPEASQ